MPVLVRENGMLIAGHGRLEAAKLEGITEVPTIILFDRQKIRKWRLAGYPSVQVSN